MPSAYIFLPRDLGDAFSPLVGQEPVEPVWLRAPLVQPSQAFPGSGGDRRLAPRPAASLAPPLRPGSPYAPRCGPRSAIGPTVRSGRPARAQRRAGHGRRGGEPTGRRCRPARLSAWRTFPFSEYRSTSRSSAANSASSAAHASGPFGCSTAALASLSGIEAPAIRRSCDGSRRADLAAEAGHRRRVDRREPKRQGPDEVAQLAPGQRRGEQDVDVAAAGRRDIGDVPGAEALEQLAELGRLVVDVAAGHGPGQVPASARWPSPGHTPAPCTAGPEGRRAAAGRAAPGRCGRRRARSGRAAYRRSGA